MFSDPLFVPTTAVLVVSSFIGGAIVSISMLRKWVRRDERERMQADEQFFRNLRVEREFWPESRGYLFKEKWIVIRERLLYKRFPLSGWMRSETKVDESVDLNAIDKLAGSLSQLISEAKTPFTIKSVVHHLPAPSDKFVSALPALGHKQPKA